MGGLTAVPVDGKIYVIGGWGGSSFESVVKVYDYRLQLTAPVANALYIRVRWE